MNKEVDRQRESMKGNKESTSGEFSFEENG